MYARFQTPPEKPYKQLIINILQLKNNLFGFLNSG